MKNYWQKPVGSLCILDAIKGLELFNQGDYFGAHEYLEEAWKDDLTAGRDLYQGDTSDCSSILSNTKGELSGSREDVPNGQASGLILYQIPAAGLM